MTLEDITVRLAAALPPLRLGAGVSVLCYHQVCERSSSRDGRFVVSAAALSRHLDIVAGSGHPVVQLPDLPRIARAAVLITFDDNLPSHVTHALPVLRTAAAPAVFFLSPGDLGRPGELSRRDVDTLINGGMYVGAHGLRHALVHTIDPTAFARDVTQCGAFLRSLGMPLTWAYPGGYIGSFTPTHDRILQDHGFDVRFSTLEGVCDPRDRAHVQGRYVIRRDSSEKYVGAAVAGGLQLLGVVKRARAIAAASST